MPKSNAVALVRVLLDRAPNLVDQYDLYLAIIPQKPTEVVDLLIDIADGYFKSTDVLRAAGHLYPAQLYACLSETDIVKLKVKFTTSPHGQSKYLFWPSFSRPIVSRYS